MVIGTRARRIKIVNYYCHVCGAIRPKAVSPLFLCPECGGGMQKITEEVKVKRPRKPICTKCQGTGMVDSYDASTPVGGTIPIMTPCDKCKGTGKL